jgi:hypothetical protein
MWNCGSCGCKLIAASLMSCPMCFKERDMPRNTVGGGLSDSTTDSSGHHTLALEAPEKAEEAPVEPEKAPETTDEPENTPEKAEKAPE